MRFELNFEWNGKNLKRTTKRRRTDSVAHLATQLMFSWCKLNSLTKLCGIIWPINLTKLIRGSQFELSFNWTVYPRPSKRWTVFSEHTHLIRPIHRPMFCGSVRSSQSRWSRRWWKSTREYRRLTSLRMNLRMVVEDGWRSVHNRFQWRSSECLANGCK